MTLFSNSIQIIKKYQHPSGGYVACPNFENYHFSWLRDGSFIAYAMDAAGEHESAAKFHGWVAGVLSRYGYKVDQVAAALEEGADLKDKDFLFTRYTLEGREDHEDDGWGNFQYDGYGTWLWALKEHVALTDHRALLGQYQMQILQVVRYLTLVWKLPSYDCWEEHPELLHPYSISAAYGGLQAVLAMVDMGLEDVDLEGIVQTLAEMKAYVARYGTGEAGFLKHISPEGEENPLLSSGVDSSLLGLAVPYGMFALEESEMAKTIQAVKSALISPGGGVYRFLKDTYYGGGEWILLTAWLGWAESLSGDVQAARERLAWIESQVNGKGWLPEQVEAHLLAPEYLQHWEQLWGKSATPLLWSHAMYIILYQALQAA